MPKVCEKGSPRTSGGAANEDLFLDHRVHRQDAADLSRELAAVARIAVTLGQRLIVLEQRVNVVVVLLQDIDRVDLSISLGRGDGCNNLVEEGRLILR
jgi:hypothetical protein